MVRVISQGFNTPRSRHSSGEEMIDRFAAMKAISALNENEKQFLFKENSLVADCNTDTNDSFSGIDSDEEARTTRKEEESNNSSSYQDPTLLKKEKRRQRNKLSAQSYRQRRRVQTSAAQKTLESLEARHKILMEKVNHMEAEKHIVEEYLKNCKKIPWCPYHQTGKPLNCTPPPCIPEDAPAPPVPGVPRPSTTVNHSTFMPLNLHVENNNMPLSMHMENNNMPLSMHVENNNMPLSMHMENNNMPLSMHVQNNNMPLSMHMSGLSASTEFSGSLVS